MRGSPYRRPRKKVEGINYKSSQSPGSREHNATLVRVQAIVYYYHGRESHSPRKAADIITTGPVTDR